MPVKKILPGVTFIISLYFSFLFALGLIIGYLGFDHFHKKALEKGNSRAIFLNFGKWQIHFHHWLVGILVFLLIWIAGWLHIFPKFCLGAIWGLVFHDIYLDREWYKVILRK